MNDGITKLLGLSISIFAGLTGSNFLAQIIGDHMWKVAVERSFFQGVAIVILAWIIRKDVK
jgi:ABC-type proline/glycine betaine transport system permease subunit